MNKIQIKKCNFQIQSTLIEFNDLDAEITEQFKILYQEFFNQGKIQLTTNFINKQVNPTKAARHRREDRKRPCQAPLFFGNMWN